MCPPGTSTGVRTETEDVDRGGDGSARRRAALMFVFVIIGRRTAGQTGCKSASNIGRKASPMRNDPGMFKCCVRSGRR